MLKLSISGFKVLIEISNFPLSKAEFLAQTWGPIFLSVHEMTLGLDGVINCPRNVTNLAGNLAKLSS